MDFSDIGGVPVGGGGPAASGQEFSRENFSPNTAQIDFSDLGGKPVAPDEGAIAAAGRGALRNFPLAQQAAAAVAPINPFSEKGDYSGELQHLTEAAEASKAAHPVAYGAGAVGGSLAPLLIPGAGEALEAAPILGNAGLAAVQSQSDTNVTKPTLQNAKDAATAAAIGGGIGAIGKGLRALAPSEKTLAANSTGAGLGFNARGAQRLMTGADPEKEIADLGQWANSATTAEGKTLAEYLRPGERLKALTEIHDSAGKEIGGILDKIAPESSIPKASLTKDLYPLADELETLAPKEHAEVMGVINKINKLADAGRLDLPALNKVKSFVGEASVDNPTMARVYGHLAESVNGVIDEYGRVIGDPAERAAYDAARIDYRNASRLLPILRRAEGRELAQGPLGNSGLLGMFGLASGVAAGHPGLGAGAMGASAIARPIANMIGKNVGLRAVPYMPEIAAGARGLNTAAQVELANALESKFRKGKE